MKTAVAKWRKSILAFPVFLALFLQTWYTEVIELHLFLPSYIIQRVLHLNNDPNIIHVYAFFFNSCMHEIICFNVKCILSACAHSFKFLDHTLCILHIKPRLATKLVMRSEKCSKTWLLKTDFQCTLKKIIAVQF